VENKKLQDQKKETRIEKHNEITRMIHPVSKGGF
jgi:hypothetical protein